jgi:hypothetical protein
MNKKGFVVSLIIAVIAILVIGGVLVYQNKKAEVLVIGGNDWKTYTNDEHGFEINYPSDWKVFNTQLVSRIAFGKYDQDPNYDGELFLSIYKSSEKSADTILNDYRSSSRAGDYIAKQENIVIDGIPAILQIIANDEIKRTTSSWEYDIVVFEKNGYTFSLSNGATKSDLFNYFCKSFKFISSSIEDSTPFEKATGIIKSVYNKEGKNYLDIDYIVLNPNWKPGGMSGPAYTNDSHAVRTFEVSPNVLISLSDQNNEISFLEFSNYFLQSHYRSLNPWSIEVENKIITKIHELYLP